MRVGALILAAGRGSRFGSNKPKQYENVNGVPILRRAIEPFLEHASIDRVRVVVNQNDMRLYHKVVEGLTIEGHVIGGRTRQETVRRGLVSLRHDPPDVILIHDGVRPFVQPALIDRVLEALQDVQGAVPAVSIVDSLKLCSDGIILADAPRDNVFAVQTPQGFNYRSILAAHEINKNGTYTDDAAVAQKSGLKCQIVRGDYDNFKITTREDLSRANEKVVSELADIRFGHGFDVHRLVPGKLLRLCGIDIPHSAELYGHSDADVALHALTDALLGAIGDRDIGYHFPPNEETWANVDSSIFVDHALNLICEKRGDINHVDITIICQTPKIEPYRQHMQKRVSEMLRIPSNCVSIKATTSENLGVTAENRGIAAQATATVRLPK